MEELLDFLRRLDANNNRAWFDEHRAEWLRSKRWIAELTEDLIAGISQFDSTVRGLRPQDCTFRIARDTRFSKDKTPYKNWVGIYIAPHGRHGGYAGYYLHISPNDDGLIGQHMLVPGLYCPEPVVLRSVREEILDHGDEMQQHIDAAARHGYQLDRSNCLKRTPTGFPAGTPHDDLLRLKDIYVAKPLTEAFLLGERLAERIVEELRPTYPLIEQLNRAVQYAYEEMQ